MGVPHDVVVSELGVNVTSVNSLPMSFAVSSRSSTLVGSRVPFDEEDELDDFVDDDESVV